MGNCAGTGPSNEPSYALEFGDSPSGADSEVANEAGGYLKRASDILGQLRNFRGCGELVREAITNPSQENEERAWAAVVPSVEILKEFYEFSLALEKAVHRLFTTLCLEPAVDSDLADAQALTKRVAEVFDFVLRFDDMKMTNPAIQNDFSYYRRILNRIKLSNKRDAGITVGDELANAMSLFFAYPTPMMNSLIKTTTSMINESTISNEGVSKFLARLTNSCYMLANDSKKSLSPQVSMLCFRTITGAVILYDHVNPKGAFHKKSPIHIKGSVTVLKAWSGEEKTDSLVNALRFNTVHLNEDETPGAVKALLA